MEEISSSEPASKKLRTNGTMPLDSVILRFAKLTENAFTPTRGSKLAAGYDLYRSHIFTLGCEKHFLTGSGWDLYPVVDLFRVGEIFFEQAG